MDWRTVEKNVSLPLEMMGWDRAKRKERVRELLELVELTGFEGHYPWQLSGGMQQRVAIARALTFNPSLILMDEPFGALDEMTRDRLNLELLRIWEATSATVVFVTHSIAEAVFLSTRIVVMSARPGRVQRIVEVDLPYPRTTDTREETRFFELATEVRELLRESHGARETAPEAEAVTRLKRGFVEWAPALVDPRARPGRLGARREGVRDPEVPAPEAERDPLHVLGRAAHPLAGRVVHVHGGLLGLRHRLLGSASPRRSCSRASAPSARR